MKQPSLGCGHPEKAGDEIELCPVQAILHEVALHWTSQGSPVISGLLLQATVSIRSDQGKDFEPETSGRIPQ